MLIDPGAGISVSHPAANKTARDDVEKAIMEWGRLLPVLDGQNPDLIIVVRKGQGKLVGPTIGGVPNDNERPVVLQPTDNGIRLGAATAAARCRARRAARHRGSPQGRGGPSERLVGCLCRGCGLSLDHPPFWRYVAKDALRSPDVPVVAEFRKHLEETEKQEKSQP